MLLLTLREFSYLLIICLFSMMLSGCSARPAVGGKVLPAENSYTVTDDSGYTMTMPDKPKRIVSLAYGIDEILVELVSVDRILAFSRYAGEMDITFITPDQAAKVSNRAVPYAEAIIALRPDLVLITVSTLRPEAVQTLREVGIPVYISNSPRSVKEVKQRVMKLAQLVGEEEKGQDILVRMEERLRQVEKKLASITPEKRKCCMAFDFTGVIGSKNNLLADIFEYAHLRNGALQNQKGSIQGENRLSKEQIVAVNPDIFLLPTWNYDGRSGVDDYYQQFMSDPALQHVNAVRNHQVKMISDRYRYVSSHHVVESIEVFAKTAYPELF